MDGIKKSTDSGSRQKLAKQKSHFFQIGNKRVNTWFVLVGVAMMSLLVFSLGGGGITGGVVQTEQLTENVVDVVDKRLQRIDTDFKNIKAEIEQCIIQRNELDATLVVAAKEFNACKKSIEESQAQVVVLEENIALLQTDYQSLYNSRQDELLNVQSKFEDVISDAARRICCKERVDNPNVNSFILANNAIECVNGGDFELQC